MASNPTSPLLKLLDERHQVRTRQFEHNIASHARWRDQGKDILKLEVYLEERGRLEIFGRDLEMSLRRVTAGEVVMAHITICIHVRFRH